MKTEMSIDSIEQALETQTQREWVGLTDDAIYAAAEIAWRAGWVACCAAESVNELVEDEEWAYQGATVAQLVKTTIKEKNT